MLTLQNHATFFAGDEFYNGMIYVQGVGAIVAPVKKPSQDKPEQYYPAFQILSNALFVIGDPKDYLKANALVIPMIPNKAEKPGVNKEEHWPIFTNLYTSSAGVPGTKGYIPPGTRFVAVEGPNEQDKTYYLGLFDNTVLNVIPSVTLPAKDLNDLELYKKGYKLHVEPFSSETYPAAQYLVSYTYSEPKLPTFESEAMLRHNRRIAALTLFEQTDFLPNLLEHGEGFWATANLINTKYDGLKVKGAQGSVEYSHTFELAGLKHQLGLGFHYNQSKNDEHAITVKTQHLALSLYDTITFNNDVFVGLTGFVGHTHGDTQLTFDSFAKVFELNNSYNSTNLGAAFKVGKRFALPKHLSITPSVGLVYERLGSFSFTNAGNIEYKGKSVNLSLVTAGAKLHWAATPRVTPYASLDYYQPLAGKFDIELSDKTGVLAGATDKLKGWGVASLGVTYHIKPTMDVSANASAIFGPQRKDGFGLGAKFNYRF